MLFAQSTRISLFVLVIFLFAACEKRTLPVSKKIIGTWKSVSTLTEMYEEDNVLMSHLLESDKNNFSILTFDKTGRFQSIGQYAVPEADSLAIIKLNQQSGKYRIIDHKLITKLEYVDKEAELTLIFKGNDKLIVTVQTPIDSSINHSPRYFVASTTYLRQP